MEEVKPEQPELVQIDLNKLCRACLNESSEMRSIFLPDSSTGESLVIADMLMDFANIQVDSEDGLPILVCLPCAVQIGRAYAFKQLCEQSDSSLRQYLGKPLLKKHEIKDNEEIATPPAYSVSIFDDLVMDSTSSESDIDDQFKDLLPEMPSDPTSEKIIAQQQLLKLARNQKSRSRKRRVKKSSIATPQGPLVKKRPISTCNVCKKKFLNFKAFRKHLRTHIEDRPFKCKQCSRSFTEENYLNNHMRSHLPEEEKPHECNICKKRFIHPTMLQKHLLRHTNERPFVCKICNKGCFAENSLLKHMKIHEKKEGDPGLLKHICDYCRTEFPGAEALSNHIKQHTGAKPFVCNICGKCFPQRFNLDLHLRTHTGERPFKCEMCKKGYVSKASLKIHMRTHTNERPFACEFCGKAFRQSGDLTSHKRLHGTDKPIECSVCQKRFTTVMKLKYHMRNHTGERPYVCTVCNRGFTVNTILLRHMRVHSGERPYVCVTCGKAFSQTSTLNNHMKVHANTLKAAQEKYSQNCQQLQQQQQQIIIEQSNRLMEDSRMLQPQPEQMRMIQPDTTHDTSRLIADTAHLLADNRIIQDDSRSVLDPRLVVNVVEPTRLLVNDSRLVTIDNRMLHNVDNRNLEGARILSDKYLAYGSFHRGQL
ncbi:unnamed protein product [Ceutorhynchus assimilis]|uniref:Uncharacterized protein n=1 Tax=Ceutorhynchus assimilis TaxID=467358 RepID=A0A9N9MJF5_9CUCU|nr:unnamed protein product [Ceutorhynchus assimilis]